MIQKGSCDPPQDIVTENNLVRVDSKVNEKASALDCNECPPDGVPKIDVDSNNQTSEHGTPPLTNSSQPMIAEVAEKSQPVVESSTANLACLPESWKLTSEYVSALEKRLDMVESMLKWNQPSGYG
jgi:hypothetical protein